MTIAAKDRYDEYITCISKTKRTVYWLPYIRLQAGECEFDKFVRLDRLINKQSNLISIFGRCGALRFEFVVIRVTGSVSKAQLVLQRN